MTPEELANARAAQPGEAGWASIHAIVSTSHGLGTDFTYDDWPISGDDLALTKAGVIA